MISKNTRLFATKFRWLFTDLSVFVSGVGDAFAIPDVKMMSPSRSFPMAANRSHYRPILRLHILQHRGNWLHYSSILGAFFRGLHRYCSTYMSASPRKTKTIANLSPTTRDLDSWGWQAWRSYYYCCTAFTSFFEVLRAAALSKVILFDLNSLSVRTSALCLTAGSTSFLHLLSVNPIFGCTCAKCRLSFQYHQKNRNRMATQNLHFRNAHFDLADMQDSKRT